MRNVLTEIYAKTSIIFVFQLQNVIHADEQICNLNEAVTAIRGLESVTIRGY